MKNDLEELFWQENEQKMNDFREKKTGRERVGQPHENKKEEDKQGFEIAKPANHLKQVVNQFFS